MESITHTAVVEKKGTYLKSLVRRVALNYYKMKTLLLIATLTIVIPSFAQDKSILNLREERQKIIKTKVDTTKQIGWETGILYSLTFSQGTLSNWAAGGDNFSLSMESILDTYARYRKDKLHWDNYFDFNLGFIYSTSLGSRKNDDRFDLLSKVGYSISAKSDLALLGEIRSGFFKGYTYKGSESNFTSNFMSPGYLLSSAGWDYRPNKNLDFFLSPFSARWVFVLDPVLSMRGLYGVKPGLNFNLEQGAFAEFYFFKEIKPNALFKTKLDIFSNYRNNPKNLDIFWTNILSIKISKIFNITWSLDLIYDDDARLFGADKASPALQFKSLIGLGFQFGSISPNLPVSKKNDNPPKTLGNF